MYRSTPKPPRQWRNLHRSVSSAAVFVAAAAVLFSSARDIHAQGSVDDYERSQNYLDRTRNLVYRDHVQPNWIGDDDRRFWYRVRTGRNSHEYVLVDTEQGSRAPAFDHRQLAGSLAEASGSRVVAKDLNLQSLAFAPDAASCRFRFAGKRWRFQLPDGPLRTDDGHDSGADADRRHGLPAQQRIVSSRGGGERTPIRFENRLDRPLRYFWVMPDGKLRLYGTVDAGGSARVETYDGHAWLLKDSEGKPIAAFVASSAEQVAIVDDDSVAPKDGSDNQAREPKAAPRKKPKWKVVFDNHNVELIDTETDQRRRLTDDGSEENGYGGRVWWSPDNEHFVVYRTRRGLHRTINLIDSTPDDSIHARLMTIPYAKPGDRLDHPRLVLFSQAEDWKPRLIDDSQFPNPFEIRSLKWHAASNKFSFIYNERGHQRVRLVTIDAHSAGPRVTIDETSETFVCYSSKLYSHHVVATNEWIWMSERSGWNHLYLVDGETGDVKNAITSGDWVVRDVEKVDEGNRRLYLKVSGIDPDEDPYHVHLVRVNFDGGDLVRLTGGDGNHRWKYSPGGRFIIDTYSRVDLPPVTELRDAQSGRLVCALETADASSLMESGWQPPERFVATGRDGKSEIHGIIVRPTNFDPDKRYPVLEEIYAGPHSSFVPKDFGLHRNLYSMAELGFIVVKIDGMGTSNRSKAFHDVCWKNLADSGFPDRIAWMKAAARDRPEMDLNRVGIWGGSAGGQSAMRALIDHGDFYRAAVADCGCHDNRVDKIWWNEQWMGWPVGAHYEAQSNATGADKLQGDLMLIWGELDRNVDPASTMQVIDALVRADKDFEQLIMPGSGHGAAGHPYARRRQADFFVRKLWQCEPRHDGASTSQP